MQPEAKESVPEWYEKHVVNDELLGGWRSGRAAYDRVLSVSSGSMFR